MNGRQAPPCVLVVYGASGDLTARKLLPALASLAKGGHLSDRFAVVGVARSELTDAEFRAKAIETVGDEGGARWESLVEAFRYVPGEYGDAHTFDRLRAVVAELDADRGTNRNRVHYLATVPEVFGPVVEGIGRAGLHQDSPDTGFSRIVLEKPYGHDLASAQALDRAVHGVFAERDVYRIDHYLGKETVQNVLALRFANAIFEPVWNRRYIDHIQITVAEELGVGHRGGFYESAGALRDIVQNHVLQVLAIVGMEPPAVVDADGIRDEKVKLLRAVEILEPDEVASLVVRGQYDTGVVGGEAVVGYCAEEGVAADSSTETFVAMRLHVDNWRWAGVPIYIRTGKRLPKRVTEVAMEFRDVPHLPFTASNASRLGRNQLVVRVQPDEGISLRFGAKEPGQVFALRNVAMDFNYREHFAEEPPDAYERLLLDAMIGDPTLFIRSDEVEQAWRIVAPMQAAWQESTAVPVERYPAGTWGPKTADELIARDGRAWHEP